MVRMRKVFLHSLSCPDPARYFHTIETCQNYQIIHQNPFKMSHNSVNPLCILPSFCPCSITLITKPQPTKPSLFKPFLSLCQPSTTMLIYTIHYIQVLTIALYTLCLLYTLYTLLQLYIHTIYKFSLYTLYTLYTRLYSV